MCGAAHGPSTRRRTSRVHTLRRSGAKTLARAGGRKRSLGRAPHGFPAPHPGKPQPSGTVRKKAEHIGSCIMGPGTCQPRQVSRPPEPRTLRVVGAQGRLRLFATGKNCTPPPRDPARPLEPGQWDPKRGDVGRGEKRERLASVEAARSLPLTPGNRWPVTSASGPELYRFNAAPVIPFMKNARGHVITHVRTPRRRHVLSHAYRQPQVIMNLAFSKTRTDDITHVRTPWLLGDAIPFTRPSCAPASQAKARGARDWQPGRRTGRRKRKRREKDMES